MSLISWIIVVGFTVMFGFLGLAFGNIPAEIASIIVGIVVGLGFASLGEINR